MSTNGSDLSAIEYHVEKICESIDRTFGAGYAKRHPELIQTYLEAIDHRIFNATLESCFDSLTNADFGICEAAYQLNKIAEALNSEKIANAISFLAERMSRVDHRK